MSAIDDLPNGRLFSHDGVDYAWKGLTALRHVQLMAPDRKLLQVPDPETGFLREPTEDEFLDLLATRELVMKSEPLSSSVREKARRQRMTREEVKRLRKDKAALFRMIVLRQADRDRPLTGDLALAKWRDGIWNKEATRAAFGCWPCGSVIRVWIKQRGRRDERRWSDVTSQRGKSRTRRTDESNLAVALFHAASIYDAPGRVMYAAWTLYDTDLKRLCAGEELSFEEGRDIPRPTTPQKRISYETFRKLVHEIKNPDNVERKWSRRGRRKTYGGGGAAPEPTRPFEVVQIDDTPFPAWCIVDGKTGVVAGIPLVTIGVDVLTGVIAGRDAECGPPSSATVMRTILHCASPKVIPPRYRANPKYRLLASIGGKVGTYLFDNALQNAARAVEDMAGDTCAEVQWAGEDEPTHKQLVERTLQTLQSLLAKEMDSYSVDEKTRRELNLDPKVKAVVTLETFLMLLDDAIATIMVACDQNKAGMVPLARFELATRTDPIEWVSDLDEFEMAICDVEYDVTFDRNGLQVFEGLRHSDHEITPTLYADEVSHRKGRTMRGGGIKVKVKYRSDDISRVFMWSDFREAYVPLPCTQPLYAAGLSKWLHERIREYAKATALAFNTQDERIEARAGLVELCRSVASAATDAERRLKQRVLGSPMIRQVVGDGVVDLLVKPASPTGREMPLEHDLTAADRRDRHVVRPRRQRGDDRNQIGREGDERVLGNLVAAETTRSSPIKPQIRRTAASPTGREKGDGSERRRRPPRNDAGGKSRDAGQPQPGAPAPEQKPVRVAGAARPDWNHYE